MKKLKDDEVEKKFQFYKLFQIKQIIITRKEIKFQEKII
jgi:hypothetical protein